MLALLCTLRSSHSDSSLRRRRSRWPNLSCSRRSRRTWRVARGDTAACCARRTHEGFCYPSGSTPSGSSIAPARLALRSASSCEPRVRGGSDGAPSRWARARRRSERDAGVVCAGRAVGGAGLGGSGLGRAEGVSGPPHGPRRPRDRTNGGAAARRRRSPARASSAAELPTQPKIGRSRIASLQLLRKIRNRLRIVARAAPWSS